MGGNAWTHTGPYQPDLAAAFRQAQEDELARDNHGFGDRSVEELWRDPEWEEYIFTGGTGDPLHGRCIAIELSRFVARSSQYSTDYGRLTCK